MNDDPPLVLGERGWGAAIAWLFSGPVQGKTDTKIFTNQLCEGIKSSGMHMGQS